ncbi:SDR family oxidoreductase [Algirhabdus cladophorae]|uniref:SDR family oxidoreductase n=1 Tax=Algirhabdus cladophorae TaxID=3377108 RepID=UPI003B8469D0
MTRTYGITGVASGIGAALAQVLKAQGNRVVGYDLLETYENVDHFVPLDLADKASIRSAAMATPWMLDGLCNNAGLPPVADQAAKILQVNFTGTRGFTQAMMPHLNAGASLVNMASRAGHKWHNNLDQIKRLAGLQQLEQIARFVDDEAIDPTRAYNLSKEAVLLWTLSMTEEMVHRDIRVNSLSPGGIATGILDDFKKAFGMQMAKNVERAGRVGTPEEVAKIAAFVLSPDSHWLKGADISIDGGMGAFNMTDALGLAVMLGPDKGGTA